MSTKMRKRIETLLRDDATSSVSSYNSDEEYDNDPALNDTDEIRSYIVSSLTIKGFTPSQAQMAYTSIISVGTHMAHIDENGRNEEQLNKIHDQCLQWLCIHLNEDQLPKSFNPTGQTLDVLHHSAKQSISRSESHTQINGKGYLPELKKAVQSYGVGDKDIQLILNKASATSNTETSVQSILWNALCCASGVSVQEHMEISTNGDIQENKILIDEEFEALSAIFSPQELLIDQNEKNQSDVSTVRLYLPNSDLVDDATLNIFIQPQLYPIYNYPIVLLSGTWKRPEFSVHIHIEIIKFLFSLHLGEPMVYELHGFASNLIQNDSIIKGNLDTLPRLTPFLIKEEGTIIGREQKSSPDNHENRNPKNTTQRHIKPLRPRVKSDFWSKPPHLASAAVSNPRIQSEISKARKQLPAADSREEFLSMLRQSEKDGNRVSVVTGATGCGKSTQLPQFILEDQPTSAKIVVTQPRRLAATGVASRVAVERGEGLPGEGSVGYAVRGEVKCNKNTRLLFCTTGVLLRHMQSEAALENITHIVIDECHERNLDTDILLGLLKALLPSLPHLKVTLCCSFKFFTASAVLM
jgi:ATP-dependent RNA helicase DHX57